VLQVILGKHLAQVKPVLWRKLKRCGIFCWRGNEHHPSSFNPALSHGNCKGATTCITSNIV